MSKIADLPKWKAIGAEDIFVNKRLTLRQETCELPGGRVIDDYFTLQLPDGAVIVPITTNDEIVLVRQYKHGYGDIVLELPAGNVEKDEDANDTIIRELAEETGYVASSVEYVSKIISKPGRMMAVTHVYFAMGAEKTADAQLSDQELIETIIVPIEQLDRFVGGSGIITETSLAALFLVRDKLVG